MPSKSRGVRLLCEPLNARRLLASVSPLLQYDFNTGTSWQQSPGALSAGVTASLVQGGYGTIDTEGGTTNTGALRLTVDSAPATPWTADLTSGILPVTTTETNVGKLTLSFTLSATQLKPVKVIVTSYNTAGTRTGGLATTIIPAATFYNQRFALDLSTMTPSGSGTFTPTSGRISFDFEMASSAGWNTATAAQLRLDNVNYSKPALYVNAALPSGGTHNGLSEATAFRTPQEAMNVSQAGDIILLMNGTYNNITFNTGALTFVNPGTPAAWISVKNYPGQSPVIYNEAYTAIKVGHFNTYNGPAQAYLEVRGLHVIGDSPKIGTRDAPDGAYNPDPQYASKYGPYAQYIGQGIGQVNANGIGVDGRYDANRPHDIRIADNIVEDCSGAGIGAGDCDRVQIENNITRDNCYWDVYASSGISVLSTYNFDGTSGNYTRLVRNNISSGNIHKEKWAQTNGYSDGNGIIIDINKSTAIGVPGDANYVPAKAALGRTLVTNNLTYDNGGGGVHIYNADHVDVLNNTSYLNSASPYLKYAAIDLQASSDSRAYNNIAVAPTGSGEPVNNSGSASSYKYNVYSGGGVTPLMGTGDIVADPKFVFASVDAAIADFRLQSTSPAINRGQTALAPYLDLAGNTRYGNPDSGAYEFIPPAPAALALAAVSDTGTAGDNKTNLNNTSAATRLSFTVTGTLSGATVALYNGTTLLGTAPATGTTTMVQTNGTAPLADGPVAVTAMQTFAGAPSAFTAATAITVETVAPTAVGTLVVDDGTGQRSRVRTAKLTFSEAAVLDAAGLTVTNALGAAVPFTVAASAGSTVFTLSFAGPSLDDGVYTVAVAATALRDTAGNPLAAGLTAAFHRLYGDIDGNGRVDISDFNAFAPAFGTNAGNAGYIATLDFEGNGTIDISDFNAFAPRFGTSVPVPAAVYTRAPTKGLAVKRV